MFRPHRIAIAAALTALLALPEAATADQAEPPLEDSITAAREQGKALVIEFYTTWCGPCKEFKAKVLPQDAVQKALGAVHFVQYDAEHGHGLPAAERYHVNGYPTFVVIDGTGKMVLKDMGSMTAERFVAFVARADLEVLDEASLDRRIARDPYNPITLIAAARWHRGRGNVTRALDLYRRAGAADRGNQEGVAADASWERAELRRYHRVRDDMVREYTAYMRQYPSSAKAMWAFRVVAASGALEPARLEAIASLLVDGMRDDASALNSAVYSLLAAGAPRAAIAAAERQVALDPSQANPYDSLAEALHYAGRQADAIAASKKGLALASPAMKPIFAANLARFEKPGRLPVYDVDIARYRAGEVLRSLPGEDPALQKHVSEPRQPNPDARERRALQTAAFRAARDAGTSCAEHARKLDEVYVRLELGAKRKVVVLEPGAPRKLVRCLTRELASVELPAAKLDKLTVPVPLKAAAN